MGLPGPGRTRYRLDLVSALLLAGGVAVVVCPAIARSDGTGPPFGLIISEQARTSFTLVGAGARAAGMGGAFTALADDATAASFNPAGLAQLLVPELSGALRFSRIRDEYRGFQSFDQTPPLPLTDTTIGFDRNRFDFASATLPFQLFSRRFAFQLSTQRVVDFSYSGTRHFHETDASGTTLYELDQKSEQSGAIYTYSASLACQPTERMLLGVTVNRWDGRWDFASTNQERGVLPGAERETFTYSQTNRLSGWNFDLGLLLRYPYFNVGLRYRTPFDATYRFSAKLDTNIETSLEPLPDTRTTLHWPGSLNIGVALKPSDTLLLAADWGRTDWSGMALDVPGSGRLNFFDLAPENATLTQTTEDWRAGAEYLLFLGRTVVPIRAGWFREPQPARDAVTGERVVRTGVSLGAGVKRGWLSIDAAVTYATSSTRVSRFLEAEELASGNLRATSRGTLDRRDLSALVSVIVQVPKGSAPERILHEIFVGPSRKVP